MDLIDAFERSSALILTVLALGLVGALPTDVAGVHFLHPRVRRPVVRVLVELSVLVLGRREHRLGTVGPCVRLKDVAHVILVVEGLSVLAAFECGLLVADKLAEIFLLVKVDQLLFALQLLFGLGLNCCFQFFRFFFILLQRLVDEFRGLPNLLFEGLSFFWDDVAEVEGHPILSDVIAVNAAVWSQFLHDLERYFLLLKSIWSDVVNLSLVNPLHELVLHLLLRQQLLYLQMRLLALTH